MGARWVTLNNASVYRTNGLYRTLSPSRSVSPIVLVVQRFGIRLVIEGSQVRLPVGALSSQLGQLSLPFLRGT